jgi:hypothetical protein
LDPSHFWHGRQRVKMARHTRQHAARTRASGSGSRRGRSRSLVQTTTAVHSSRAPHTVGMVPYPLPPPHTPPRTSQFDISKIPDIYDVLKYGAIHNDHFALPGVREMYLTARALADLVVPQVRPLGTRAGVTCCGVGPACFAHLQFTHTRHALTCCGVGPACLARPQFTHTSHTYTPRHTSRYTSHTHTRTYADTHNGTLTCTQTHILLCAGPRPTSPW